MQLVQQRPSLILRHVLENSLQDSASVRMSSKGKGLADESLTDEAIVLRLDALKRALQDVVGVLILRTLDDFALEFFDECVLLINEDEFKCLRSEGDDLLDCLGNTMT